MGGSAAPAEPQPPSSSSPTPSWNGPGDRPAAPASGSGPATRPGGSASGPGPSTPGPGPSTGGPYLTKPRGPTTRMELEIKWDHPVPPKDGDPERTAAIPRRALPLVEALAIIRGNDPRPLLVLRECARCSGTEDALLARMEDNERTYLMSRWFHCVKLPPAVLEPDHPFHELFPGEEPAHLFLSRADGSLRHDLSGVHAQGELWAAMKELLASEYRSDPEHALVKLSKILDGFDELDERILALERRIERTVEEQGEDGTDLGRLRRQLAEMCVKRDEMRADAVTASKLGQLQPEPPVKKAG